MSTKSTIAHGHQFHLYSETFDDDNVYLEVNDETVTIPIAAWEVIRQYGAFHPRYRDMSDAEIAASVEREVDQRIAEYQAAPENKRKLLRMLGGAWYGGADTPRQEQILRGIASSTRQREHEQRISGEIEALRKA